MPSLLDRLLDPDAEGTTWQRGYGPAQMIESVRRDLEDLFNTHSPPSDPDGPYPEVARSVAAYGLPDLPTLDILAGGRKAEIPRMISEIVARFEPRLRDIRVNLIGEPTEGDRRVRLQIEANLNVDPSPEVAFETILELATGKTSIRASDS